MVAEIVDQLRAVLFRNLLEWNAGKEFVEPAKVHETKHGDGVSCDVIRVSLYHVLTQHVQQAVAASGGPARVEFCAREMLECRESDMLGVDAAGFYD